MSLSGWLRWGSWFVIGSCVGSFLNVCIYRMPREESIVKPRSRCPHCSHPIAWYDNVPILSYFLLGARCRHCHKSIHWRYPLVELLTGVLTIVVLRWFGITPLGFIYLAFVWALIAVTFIDIDFQIIPDEISLGGLVAGLILSLIVPQLHGTDHAWLGLWRAVVGALVGGGLLYGTGVVGTIIFRKEAMGGGDVKLLAMAGSLLGWKLMVLTFFLAPVLAIVPGLCVLVLKRSHVIPYGPFLALALALSLFVGPTIIRISGIEETVQVLWFYMKPGH